MKTNEYEDNLYRRLCRPAYAVEYLNSILEENDPNLLLLGLRDVAKAYGFAYVADVTGHGRESLYKALSKGKNPRIGTIMDVLSAVGCKIKVIPQPRVSTRRAVKRAAGRAASKARAS